MEKTSPIIGMGLHPENLQNHRTSMANPGFSRLRKFLVALFSMALLYYVYTSLSSNTQSGAFPSSARLPPSSQTLESNHTLVPLEAHIMSKCPDAKDCLEDLVVPAMEQVVDKVNFTLSFIGTYVTPRSYCIWKEYFAPTSHC